ncbi:MAG: hypothetical protein KDH96_10410 [Candidatus Riesia sp.]|nr:hypothetical protein [Candidatus Riesia sp.]
MAIYTDRDIQTAFNGDIELSPRGDLKLADSIDTIKSAVNFVLRTDYKEYQPDYSVGCNLGSFVGKLNTESNRDAMAYSITRILGEKVLNPEDLEAFVVPFDIDEVLCVIKIGGYYLKDEVLQTVEGDKLSYTFPYMEGSYILPITVD